jgi:hypothetical protein
VFHDRCARAPRSQKRRYVPGVEVARGPGPRWFRTTLVVCAAIYYFLLLRQSRNPTLWLQPVTYFGECTSLFPNADRFALDFRLEGWSCADQRWEPMDPRPYFPIEADDKESRFQRLAYFYASLEPSRPAMRALGAYIVAHHPQVTDGVTGAIGGIRVSRLAHPLPPPGTHIERYVYRPTAPPLADDHLDHLYWTPQSMRTARCGGGAP